MQDDPHEPAPRRGYYLAAGYARDERATAYPHIAPHGWEFLLDNHLREEEDRGAEVKHAAVLGEN